MLYPYLSSLFPTASSYSAESSQQETIAAAKKGSIGILTLNRPKALNALNNTVMHEVVAQLEAYDKDPDVRTIIITGSGEKAFAAGADIKMMASLSYMDVQKGKMFQEWDRIMKVSKPIIAAVNGFALGGGCELAMMCDIIVAADTAKFGQPEIKLGTIPGMGGTQRLVRAVGKSKAMELVLGGGMWSAAEAEKAGLVARVYPLADLMAETEKLAETIGGYSVPIVALAKVSANWKSLCLWADWN